MPIDPAAVLLAQSLMGEKIGELEDENRQLREALVQLQARLQKDEEPE